MSPIQAGKISIVVPAYNEEDVLEQFHSRITSVLADLPYDYEIIYVNDGSSDNTVAIIKGFREHNGAVALVDLSRNFGKEIALTAGLDHATGDAIVVIDADLQDPPELIPTLLEKWRQGFDMVNAHRIERRGDSFLKRTTAGWFYRVMQRVGDVQIPENVGDFRLLSRRALDELKRLREHHRFMKGLFTWVGFAQTSVDYQREVRGGGETKWNYWRLWNFALEGITSFTTAPLRLASYVGMITALGAFVYGIYKIIVTLLFGDPVAGYPSLVVIVLFMGGIQLLAIGVMGEYLGRIFNETKNRPLYIVQEYLPGVVRGVADDTVIPRRAGTGESEPVSHG